MIYVCTQVPSPDPVLEARLLCQVPEVHRTRILQYRQAEDRLRSLLCWKLLKYGWQREWKESLPELIRKKNGKLYVKEAAQTVEGRYFNFSHCKTGVCCAIGSQELGVDMQEVRAITPALLTRCCNAQELVWLARQEHQELSFAMLWSRKEAMGKLDGRGIALDLQTLGWTEDGRWEIPIWMEMERISKQSSDFLYGRSWYLTEDTALAICYRGERQVHMEQLVSVAFCDLM